MGWSILSSKAVEFEQTKKKQFSIKESSGDVRRN